VLCLQLTLVIMSPDYMDYLYLPNGGLNWRGDATVLLGMVAAASLSLPALASLPDVSGQLDWRSWVFMQSTAGLVGLLAATSHTVVLGIEIWFPLSTWSAGMPPVSLTAAILPIVTLLLRLVVFIWEWTLHTCHRCGLIRAAQICHSETKGQVQIAVYQRV
jgi:hypothetical protein